MTKREIGSPNYYVEYTNIKFEDIDEHIFTKNINQSDNKKILIIDSLDNFDKFTNKYGIINNIFIEIKWNDVAKDYKGFFLLDNDDNNLCLYRFYDAPFNNTIYGSWWDSEYYAMDVLIFI